MYHVITFSYRCDPTQKPELGPFLPTEIHQLYETSLLNLVGCEKLAPELCGEEIFKKIRLKFSNAMTQRKKKVITKHIIDPQYYKM